MAFSNIYISCITRISAGVWNVTTVTGEHGSNGTITNAALVLCGEHGETAALPLEFKTKEKVKPKSVDHFEVRKGYAKNTT